MAFAGCQDKDQSVLFHGCDSTILYSQNPTDSLEDKQVTLWTNPVFAGVSLLISLIPCLHLSLNILTNVLKTGFMSACSVYCR